MRRTYASKKDTGGGLDHKDLIHTVDEKSSVFDAYYIRNIKQTKRELSCMGSSNQYGAISKKVCKKKYVRRIVKDVSPTPAESISRSAFLTPDKSIHVKKELDPFDMLLSSSTANIDEPDKSIHMHKTQDKFEMLLKDSPLKDYKVSNLFESLQPKRVEKRCLRKKIARAKKFSYSSEESTDSNKENSVNDLQTPASNTSDIMSHELVIEKVASISPKHLNESINNIVNNISLLNNCRKSSIGGLRSSVKFRRNRLTASTQSPILQKSPLCSTPFKAKYRGDSIFKFSPINPKEENSPCFVTIVEDRDKTEVIDRDTNILDDPKSPLSHLHETEKCENRGGKCLIDVVENNEDDDSIILNNETDKTMSNNEPIENLPLSIQSYDEGTSIVNETGGEIHSLQTTEIEPFLGFPHNIEKDEVKSISIDESHNDSIIENIVDDYTIFEDHSIPRNTSVECYFKPETVQNDTSKDGLDLIENEQQFNQNTTNQCDNSKLGDIYDLNSYDTDLDIQTSQNDASETDNSSMCVDDETYDVSSSNSQDDGRESLYNTCSSEDSFEGKPCFNKIPIVLSERMNDSLFQKYYKNYVNYDDDDDDDDVRSNQSVLSDDYASLESGSDEKELSLDVSRTNSENDNEGIDDLSSNNELSLKEDSSSEDRCISFVTTRKRNEVTNNSMISVFNASCNSTSTDCDKTIIINTETTLKESELDNNKNQENAKHTTQDDRSNRIVEDAPCIKSNENDTKISDNVRINPTLDESIRPNTPDITTRKTSKSCRESIKSPENSSNVPDWKPNIVLRPGKKWERSLSIYRRITMMTDHFDHSILEEEPMDTKGRKYRQSVISTMELQEVKGPLHNESINNRRSTFVSKPNRSTIRILKDPDNSRISLCNTAIFDDSKGFLTDECDDTLIELSKLSIADAGHEVTVLDLHDTSTNRITTARDYVLRRCNQTEAINFDECYPDTVLKNCHKIGEGVYGEVFLWRARDGRARVMKIVPVAGDVKVNGEHQKDFHEIISEIVIAMELSALRAPIADIDRLLDEGKEVDALEIHAIQNATDVFNEVLAIRCVYGGYPSRLLDLWDLFDESKGSENDNPAILPPHQQYIVLELANAGLDLESYQFNNAEQAHALFLQVALALAVGEEAYQFEHRDLHWGNVLIAPSDQKFATFVLRGRTWRVARCGVAATIIDYSLSRLSTPLPGADRAALYNDLSSDDSLFDAVGDYQFQVYRLMRDKLGNDWKNFEPYTNILWLHYTVDKMITALRYKRTNTKLHKHYIEKLKAIKNRILEYGSCVQFVLTDNEF